jgi:8-oxo-dGTP pyrophosphatase MutT (NUDIX family)
MATARAKLNEKSCQFAALPWRDAGHGVEVLLISSRDTGRWVIPKGWPIKGFSPHASAAREAYEEAGIGGIVSKSALGQYSYDKLIDGEPSIACDVDVYPLEVMIQHPAWPEQGQRELRWLAKEAAADAVQEAGLASLIRKLR